MLLRAKANPLLTMTGVESGMAVSSVPLDMAVIRGRLEMVHELVQQVGIKRCCGPSGGVDALRQTAMTQNVSIMAVLADAETADKDERALVAATERFATYPRISCCSNRTRMELPT